MVRARQHVNDAGEGAREDMEQRGALQGSDVGRGAWRIAGAGAGWRLGSKCNLRSPGAV
jgi:hypothetical protein